MAMLDEAILIGYRPNGMYEVGLAHGLQKRVVLVTDDTKAIAFDLKDFPYVVYNGNNADLADDIADKIKWCRKTIPVQEINTAGHTGRDFSRSNP